MRTTVVSACDDTFFPLAKGLFLSLLDSDLLPPNVDLAFIDLGCSEKNIDWIQLNGISVLRLDNRLMGRLADEMYLHRRGQICRPFLPGMLPHSDVIVWMDADMWIQDVPGFLRILDDAKGEPNKVFASPEIHFNYALPGYTLEDRIRQQARIFGFAYGEEIGSALSQNPTFNSGFFAAGRNNELWDRWKIEITRLYVEQYDELKDGKYFHFCEQSAFNYVLNRTQAAKNIDPLYNYISIWQKPIRFPDGTVRTSGSPNSLVGVLHLAGGWRRKGKEYMESGLLYKRGDYLSAADSDLLSNGDVHHR